MITASLDADDPLLIETMQITLVIETLSIPLSLILVIAFLYKTRKSPQEAGLRKKNSKSKNLDTTSVYFTLTLLMVGFLFTVCQGMENWLVYDCGILWLQCVTFFFYVGHRFLLICVFLHRLITIFENSAIIEF